MNIVLTGGGTAGHVTPNLALLPSLRPEFDNIYYVGGKTGVEKEIVGKLLPYFGVENAKLRRGLSARNLVLNLAAPFKISRGRNEAVEILKKLKPNVVFSKGGYAAAPVVMAAAKLKIPVVAHESDLTVGLTNKLTLRHCVTICATFRETAAALGKKGVYTGAPIRAELYSGSRERALKTYGFSGIRPVLLAMGGSSGAAALNAALRAALPDLEKTFDIIHVCGKGNLKPEAASPRYAQTEYVANPSDIFAAADVAVSRAGSNTLSELLAMRKPAVLIPLPKGASRGDQVLNAEYFERRGVARVLPQKELTAVSLSNAARSLLRDKVALLSAMRSFGDPDGTKKIVFEILKAAGLK